MHNRWQMRQRVDLARDPVEPLQWQGALMERGDDRAHEWIVEVTEHDAPLRLTGVTVTGYFSRAGTEDTVIVEGDTALGRARVVLPRACYEVPGPMTGLMRLTFADGTTLTAAAARWQVGEGGYDAIIDPNNKIPNLQDLLDLVGQLEQAVKSAEKIKTLTATAHTLAGTEPATASVTDGETGYKLELGIPAGARWYTGTGVTGTDETGQAFADSGIPDARAGDYYLHTRTGNVYRCTQGGAAASAKWAYQGNIRGPQGPAGSGGEGGGGTAEPMDVYVTAALLSDDTGVPRVDVERKVTETETRIVLNFYNTIYEEPPPVLDTPDQHGYPVGALYISMDQTSPASIYGGTWTEIAQNASIKSVGPGVPGGITHYDTIAYLATLYGTGGAEGNASLSSPAYKYNSGADYILEPSDDVVYAHIWQRTA